MAQNKSERVCDSLRFILGHNQLRNWISAWKGFDWKDDRKKHRSVFFKLLLNFCSFSCAKCSRSVNILHFKRVWELIFCSAGTWKLLGILFITFLTYIINPLQFCYAVLCCICVMCLFWSILYTHLLHIRPSWEKDPSSAALPEV